MHEAGELVGARGFEQDERAAEIGLKRRRGGEDAAVDMRFGGEMHDRVGLFVGEQGIDQRRVADIAVHEPVARIRGDGREVGQIARVGQLIQVDDLASRGPLATIERTRIR